MWRSPFNWMSDSWSLLSISRIFLASRALPVFFSLSGCLFWPNRPSGLASVAAWFFTSFVLTYVFALCCVFSALGFSQVFSSLSSFSLLCPIFGPLFFLFWRDFFSFPSIFSDDWSLPSLSRIFLASSALPVFFLFAWDFFWLNRPSGLASMPVWFFTSFALTYVFALNCDFSALGFSQVFWSLLGFSILRPIFGPLVFFFFGGNFPPPPIVLGLPWCDFFSHYSSAY